jgi:hypothetical protein
MQTEAAVPECGLTGANCTREGLTVPLEVRCSDCDVTYRVPQTAAGKKVRCRKCNELISVPSESAERETVAKSRAEVQRSDPSRRDEALFDDDFRDDVSGPSSSGAKLKRLPGRTKTLPPRDAPAEPRAEKSKHSRRGPRSRRPQVGGSTKDKLVFAGGVMAVFFGLAVFFPFALYLAGIGFYWLSYIWVVGDAYEDEAGGFLATNNLFVMFRLLTRPLHLWPAWIFGALGVLCMLAASGRLQWLRGG